MSQYCGDHATAEIGRGAFRQRNRGHLVYEASDWLWEWAWYSLWGVLTSWGICFGQTPSPGVPFTLSKETTAIVEPLKGDGTVDYVAAINQLYGKGVTAENNGYVVWLGVMGAGQIPLSVRSRMIEALGIAAGEIPEKGFDRDGEPDDFPDRPWKSEEHPKVAKFLADNGKFLDLAVKASGKPMWWDPAVSTDGSLGQVLLPWLNYDRAVCVALCGRALLREGSGDFDGFVSDVIAVKRLTRLGAGWTMVSRLVAANIDRLVNGAIGAAVGSGSLTAAQCAQLGKALDGIAPMADITDVVDLGERWSGLDIVERLAMGNLKKGDLDTRLMEQLAPGRKDIDWNIVLRRVNEPADRGVALLRDPKMADLQDLTAAAKKLAVDLRTRQASSSKSLVKGAGESQEAYSNRVADRLLAYVTPSLGKIAGTMRECRMRDEMTRAVVAAAQYRADSSHWPGTLADLVPKYLAAVPRDVYSAGAAEGVRYIQSDAGIFIYSVGPNRVDDGGMSDANQKQDDVGVGIAPKAGGGRGL